MPQVYSTNYLNCVRQYIQERNEGLDIKWKSTNFTNYAREKGYSDFENKDRKYNFTDFIKKHDFELEGEKVKLNNKIVVASEDAFETAKAEHEKEGKKHLSGTKTYATVIVIKYK